MVTSIPRKVSQLVSLVRRCQRGTVSASVLYLHFLLSVPNRLRLIRVLKHTRLQLQFSYLVFLVAGVAKIKIGKRFILLSPADLIQFELHSDSQKKFSSPSSSSVRSLLTLSARGCCAGHTRRGTICYWFSKTGHSVMEVPSEP